MAKTIEEMAREHEVMVVNGEYEEVKETFIAGANAVLEEIEKCIPIEDVVNKPSHCILENLLNKIKELKG